MFDTENEGSEDILKKLKIDQAGINALFLTYVNAAKADCKACNTQKISKLLSGNFDLMIDQATLDRALTKKDDTNVSDVLLCKAALDVLLAPQLAIKPSQDAINIIFTEAALQAKPDIVSGLLMSHKPSDTILVDVLKQVARKLTNRVEKETYAAYKEVFKRIIAADIAIDQPSFNSLFELCAPKSKELLDLMLKNRLKPDVGSITIVLQELVNARGEKAFEEEFGAGIEEKITLLLAGEIKPEAAVIKAAIDSMEVRFKAKQAALKADKGANKESIATAEGKYKAFKDKFVKDTTPPKIAGQSVNTPRKTTIPASRVAEEAA